MSQQLFKKYSEWVDTSIYQGLSDEERKALKSKIVRETGLTWVLRPDAPPEAVEAWKADSKETKEAWAKGYIID